MREVFVEGDEVGNVDVAVELLRQHILSYLVAIPSSTFLFILSCMTPRIPVDKDVLQMELEYKIDQLLLDLPVRLISVCACILAE